MVVILYRLVVFLLSDAGNGSQVIDIFNVRIQGDGFVGIFFCSDVVVEIEFGNGAILPGLVEIGFECDDLVEILH